MRNTQPGRESTTLTVRVPMALKRRGGRKIVLVPTDTPRPRSKAREPNAAFVKALARAFRWRGMLESGGYATIAELAAAEGVNDSYLCRALRLTLLPPRVIEKAVDGSERLEFDGRRLSRPGIYAWPEATTGRER